VQTIKTAVVVVLLLVVLYGAYIAINGANTDLPPELQAMLDSESNLDVDLTMSDPSSLSSFSGSESSTGGFQSNSGLKPAAIPSFGGPAPSFGNNSNAESGANFGSLAPPKLTAIPTPNPSGSSPPSFAVTPKLKSEEPTEDTMQPKSLSAANGADSNAPVFGLNVKGSQSGLSAPSAFGTPTKTASTETNFNDNPEQTDEVAGNANKSETELVSPSKQANLTGRSYESAKQVALDQVDRGLFKEALTTLSVFYGSPELSEPQTRDLIDLLDSLSGEVIYSRRHLLDTPYVVGPGETIETIAKRFEIPSELLAKINAVDSPGAVLPGTKLKVFQGPFRAEVDMKNNEMTVFLSELYAGRFPISTGADPAPKEGVFQVLDKQRNRNYYGLGGTQIDGSDPRNPYGGWWIDLGQDVSIHGTASSGNTENGKLGCISLSPLDAGDVFSMLSRGSQVTIKR